eukprot:UN02092
MHFVISWRDSNQKKFQHPFYFITRSLAQSLCTSAVAKDAPPCTHSKLELIFSVENKISKFFKSKKIISRYVLRCKNCKDIR